MLPLLAVLELTGGGSTPLPWPPIELSTMVEAVEAFVLLLGCRKVECLPIHPCTLQKLSLGQSHTK